MPFLRTSEGARPTAVTTEDACFPGLPKDTAPNLHPVPWEHVRFTVSVMPGEDIVFRQRQRSLHAFPDWDAVGVVNRPAVAPEAFMNGLGQRVRAFSAAPL